MIDPITILMFVLIGVLIFFMIRNGRKRQQAMQEMQNGLRPGAEVMLQSGIFGTVEDLDEEENRLTVRSGTSTLVVHRNAVGQIIAPVVSDDRDDDAVVAPDDDPAFGERIAESNSQTADTDASTAEDHEDEGAGDEAASDDSQRDDTEESDSTKN